jgi:hypothetical protein
VVSRTPASQLIHQYRFAREPLGEGTYGKVFHAQNKFDDSIEIAIKMIKKGLLNE